ncbi:hypothetical protein PCAR4_1350005 [Paraburkholderia caribensis]|nr:hypothetical protein PCAR4_1350005 [Paraburkholderia caribensis]
MTFNARGRVVPRATASCTAAGSGRYLLLRHAWYRPHWPTFDRKSGVALLERLANGTLRAPASRAADAAFSGWQ